MKSPRDVVARVVMPSDVLEGTLALYVDGDSSAAVEIRGRHSVTVRPGRSISLGSYFNAFPASYWWHYTRVRQVWLALVLDGEGDVTVWRSNAEGSSEPVAVNTISGPTRWELPLSLEGFADGGAYWFDLGAGEQPLALIEGGWSVVGSDVPRRRSCTVGIATFNRPDDCLRQLRALASDIELDEVIDRVVVIDQGTQHPDALPDFIETAATLGDRLTMLAQPNMGGSGGFSRAMLEALREGVSDDILLLDDDAIAEPESILRAVRFAEHAERPVIVGGGMLHLDAPSVLYAQSEQWDHRIGWVDLRRTEAYNHDFASSTFRDSPFFHRRQRSDFNGWWMCLIPLSVIRQIGLALPLFLKGDDIEFALRAKEQGIETVSVPGIALWHMGWGGKAPTRTWEAYFLHRNRLITELLHSPHRRPSRVVLHSFLGDLKPLLSLQYSAVRLRALAVVDVFQAADSLPQWLTTRVLTVREVFGTYPDAISVASPPAPHSLTVPIAPVSPLSRAVALARAWVRHLLIPASPASRARPDVEIPAASLGWWSFSRADSALVSTSNGSANAWYQRSRRMTHRALISSIRLHLRLWWRWPRLAAELRRSADRLESPDEWAKAFEA